MSLSSAGVLDVLGGSVVAGGLMKIDVDADADDLTGDSATGRLTIGAGEDLNLYHNGLAAKSNTCAQFIHFWIVAS